MNDDNLAKMKAAMAGATQDYKRKLAAQVDATTLDKIHLTAKQIINGLPRDVPLGTLTAALMLAGIAYSEGASHANALIDGSNPP